MLFAHDALCVLNFISVSSSNVIANKSFILGIKLLQSSFNHYFLQENASSILQLFLEFQPCF